MYIYTYIYIYIYIWQFAASPLSRTGLFAKGENLARGGGACKPCAEGLLANLARATLRGGIPVRVRTAVQTRGFYSELASKLYKYLCFYIESTARLHKYR